MIIPGKTCGVCNSPANVSTLDSLEYIGADGFVARKQYGSTRYRCFEHAEPSQVFKVDTLPELVSS